MARDCCLFDNLRPLVVLEDGRVLPPGNHHGLEVRAELQKASLDGHPAVLVTLALSNHSQSEVGVFAFILLEAPLTGRPGFFRNGWQSWSFAGRWPLGSPDPDLVDAHSLHRHGHPRNPPGTGPVGTAGSVSPALAGTAGAVWSDWLTVIDGDPWLALGFVTGRDQFGDIEIRGSSGDEAERGPIGVTARSLADGRPVAPGETLGSETLAVLAGEGSPWPALEVLAAETGRRAWRLAGSPDGSPRRVAPPPAGWCTWYHYFHGITEETVLADLARLAELGPRLPLPVFQIDDGYQAAIGNWLEPNVKFPHGMKWLAARVREAGLEPGLWLAPFSVMAGAPAYDDHPDWVIRDDSGRPVEAGVNWGAPFYGLDVTHSGVQEHLRRLFRTVVRDWGYRYLKLDFIYCASLPGRRRDPRVTRAQALRRALEIVREEVPEAYILGCGSPLVPAIGLVDGMRIGPDVAPFWAAPPPLGGDPSFPSTVNSLRNVFARAFTHGRLWDNDPDCLLVRDRDTLLSPDEVRTLATALACSGGSLFLSDALSAVPEDRLDIVRRVLPPSGRPAVPVTPLAEEFPSAVVVPAVAGAGVTVLSAGADSRLAGGDPAHIRILTAAFFNWSDDPESGRLVILPDLLRATGAHAPRPERATSAPRGPRGELAWHVFDFWAGRYIGRFTEDVAAVHLPELPAHGCAVLGLVEHRRNVPTVIGSDRHVVQGPPFVSQVRTEGGGRLTVTGAPGGPDKVRLWVAVPVPFRPTGTEPALSPVQTLPQVWGQVMVYEVPAGPDGAELTLRFDRSQVTYV